MQSPQKAPQVSFASTFKTRILTSIWICEHFSPDSFGFILFRAAQIAAAAAAR